MLIQFNFCNFKSFRDEATLDLNAVSDIKDFSEREISVGNDKLLTVAAIYGANASGKSNVYSAFKYMTEYVKYSFGFGGEEDYKEKRLPAPFLFDAVSEREESSFEVFFYLPGDPEEKCYNYGFCISQKGVTEEWLNIKAKSKEEYDKVFYRLKKKVDLSGLAEDIQLPVTLTLQKETLIISLGAKLKIDVCQKVRDWFAENRFADFANTADNSYLFKRLPKNFSKDKTVQKRVIDYLSTFDNQIKDFKIKKVVSFGKKVELKYKINTVHRKIDGTESAEIPFSDESAGTLKMFALYPDLQEVLQKGSVLFVDELNARLHPLLVRNFMLTFMNPEINKNHAQLIFTTHDTWQMAKNFLRRDEIWFTNKDDKGLSTLYSLADFKELGDGDYAANYLFGEYGAIPFLSSIMKEEKE